MRVNCKRIYIQKEQSQNPIKYTLWVITSNADPLRFIYNANTVMLYISAFKKFCIGKYYLISNL